MSFIPDLYIAASITTLLAILIIGSTLIYRSKGERKFIILLILLELPMCAIVYEFVRLPLDSLLRELIGDTSNIYQFVKAIYAPITEEPAKLWPLLIPWFYRRISSKNIIRVAFALALGFGIGEAWLVASFMLKNPDIASLHWYTLNGYIGERFFVCILHAAFTGVAIRWIVVHKSVFKGLFFAMLLHFTVNFPIFLSGKNLFNLGKENWRMLLIIWMQLWALITICIFVLLTPGSKDKKWFKKTFMTFKAKIRCPGCKEIYRRPVLGIALINSSYERCPLCKKWHTTGPSDEVEDDYTQRLK